MNEKFTVNRFISAHRDVHSAKHGGEFVYIGLDRSDRWWIHWRDDGTLLDCEGIQNLEVAEKKAHARIDGKTQCGYTLAWSEVKTV